MLRRLFRRSRPLPAVVRAGDALPSPAGELVFSLVRGAAIPARVLRGASEDAVVRATAGVLGDAFPYAAEEWAPERLHGVARQAARAALLATDDHEARPFDPDTNAWRAHRAGQGIVAADCYEEGEPAQSLSDVLCNLQHWADANAVDFRAALDHAATHYDAEVEEEADRIDAERQAIDDRRADGYWESRVEDIYWDQPTPTCACGAPAEPNNHDPKMCLSCAYEAAHGGRPEEDEADGLCGTGCGRSVEPDAFDERFCHACTEGIESAKQERQIAEAEREDRAA